MASYTPNYNLKKPAGTDVVDIDDLNGNMDIVDTQLGKKIESSPDNTGMKVVDMYITYESNAWKLAIKTKDGTVHKVAVS